MSWIASPWSQQHDDQRWDLPFARNGLRPRSWLATRRWIHFHCAEVESWLAARWAARGRLYETSGALLPRRALVSSISSRWKAVLGVEEQLVRLRQHVNPLGL